MKLRSRWLLLLLFACPLVPAHAQNGFTFLDDDAEPGGYDVTARLKQMPVEFWLAKQTNGDGYHVKIESTGISLSVTQGGKTTPLAQEHEPVYGDTSFVAQRRGTRWQFILGNHVALQAEDDNFNDGQIGYKGAADDPEVQPTEAIAFDDDFMRVASDVAMAQARSNPRQGVTIATVQSTETIWTGLDGKWQDTGLTENPAAQVAQSANPFAFKSSGPGDNIATAGHPFWSDYSAAASVQPDGASAVGILMYVQDDKNYLQLYWPVDGDPQLRAVVNGTPRVLDEDKGYGPFEQKQWYRLRMTDSGGTLKGYIDDTPVLSAHSDLFGRGTVGLYSKIPADDANAEATFDDAWVRSVDDFYDEFTTPVPGRWKLVTGEWNVTAGTASSGFAMPLGKRGSYTTMGEPDWTNYNASADLAIPADGSAGLVIHHIPGVGAYLMRATGSKAALPYADSVQLVKIGGGKTEVLGQATAGGQFNGSHFRWTFGDDNGYLSVQVNGTTVLDAFDTSLPAGRAGLYAQAGVNDAPELSHFAVEFPQHKATWAKVPDLYELDTQAQTMGSWSTPQGFWVPASDFGGTTPDTTTPAVAPAPATGTTPAVADDNTLWHKGEFWGDDTLRFELPDLSGGKNVKLIFKLSDANRIQLTLSVPGDLAAEITDGTHTWNGTAKLDGDANGQPIEVDRRGTFIIVRVGKDDNQKVVMATRVG